MTMVVYSNNLVCIMQRLREGRIKELVLIVSGGENGNFAAVQVSLSALASDDDDDEEEKEDDDDDDDDNNDDDYHLL